MSDDAPRPGGQDPVGNEGPDYGRAPNYQPPPSYQQPPPSYGQPPAGAYYAPPKHPQATTALVLGIIGLVVCQVISPFAWSIGAKAVREIDANPQAYAGRSEASAGKILGIVGTVLLGLGLLVLVVVLLVAIAASA